MPNQLFENRTSQHETLLREVAERHGVSAELLEELVQYEEGRVHLKKRRNAKSDIRTMIEGQVEEQA